MKGIPANESICVLNSETVMHVETMMRNKLIVGLQC